MTGSDSRFLIVSVDCLPEAASSRGELAAAHALVELFGEHRLPATWAMADPGGPLARQLLAQRLGQRIALLAEPHWAGEPAGRTRFARELSSRLASATVAGATVRCLALRNLQLREHFDLLVRHRLAVVRSGLVPPRRQRGMFRVCSSRFGIFQFAPNANWTPQKGFLSFLWDSPRRQLAPPQARGRWTHLLIDSPAWSRYGRTEWKRLRRFLAFAEQQVRSGKVQCVTAESLVQHLQPEWRPLGNEASQPRAA